METTLDTFLEKKKLEYTEMFNDIKMLKLFNQAFTSYGRIYAKCTGSSYHHHNFIGGLFVHTYEMLDILKNTYFLHPENTNKFQYKTKTVSIDFGACAIAILFHDFGKIYEYDHTKSKDNRFPVTWNYRTIGHIHTSAEQVAIWGKQFKLSEKTINNLKHLILAHHSRKEWGSPVLPQTPEAKIVCACDLISAQLADGKPDYFADYLAGNIETNNSQEEFYNAVVLPKMEDEKRKDDIISKINKLDIWDKVAEYISNLEN